MPSEGLKAEGIERRGGETVVPIDVKFVKLSELLLKGYSAKRIAEEMGLSVTYVGILRADPVFKAYLKEQTRQATEQVQAIITDQQVASVNAIVVLRDNAEQERVKLDAAKDLLDRGGHKAIERVHTVVEHQATPELVEVLSGLLAEMKRVNSVEVEEVRVLPERVMVTDAEFKDAS